MRGRWRSPALSVAVPFDSVAQRSSPIARTNVSIDTLPPSNGTVRTTTPGVYYTDNNIPAVVYVDLNASYDFKVDGHKFELYGTITNLTNKFVFVPNTGQPTEFYPSQQSLYDVVGRYFVAGLRFDF